MPVCHNQLSKDLQPSEALANFRWIGPVPEKLRDLTWIEELLIARVHVCGSIIRLDQRNNPSSFFWNQRTCHLSPSRHYSFHRPSSDVPSFSL